MEQAVEPVAQAPFCEGVQLVKPWIAAIDQTDECRSCALAGAVPEYREMLEAAGRPDLVTKLDDALGSDDADLFVKVGEVMDEIKAEVGDDVRVELCTIDAMTQDAARQAQIEGAKEAQRGG